MIQVEKYTLPDIIKPSFQRFGDKLALSDIDGIGLSYNELENKISSISNFLIEHGIAKGDRVAILAENQPNWGVAYLSATFIGAIAVPIMTEFKDADVHHILRHSGAKAIFISEKFLDKIAELENSDLETVVILEDMSIVSLEEGADIVSKVLKDGKKELNKIISAAKVFAGLSNYTPDENDLAAIVYTSGTTGHSKGVMLSHKNIVSDIIATLDLVN
ncbi:MAG: long-chain fatty acid--CoA ligase, partial [Ignavibacteria bacterium]